VKLVTLVDSKSTDLTEQKNQPTNQPEIVSENGPPLRWFCDECDDSWKKTGSVDFMQLVTRLMEQLERIAYRIVNN